MRVFLVLFFFGRNNKIAFFKKTCYHAKYIKVYMYIHIYTYIYKWLIIFEFRPTGGNMIAATIIQKNINSIDRFL